LKAKISERYIPAIKVGDSVLVTFPTFPDMKIMASINRIGYVVNPANRTFDVEVNLNNSDNKIKPNMMATLNLKDYETNSAIVVPSYLIREDIKGKYLYIAVKESGVLMATKRYVTTGLSYKGNTEIKSGIGDGTTIITDGYNNVSDGVAIGVK
jgi:multidrug efflux pump subunit AcrA (membrane-fusion protein)